MDFTGDENSVLNANLKQILTIFCRFSAGKPSPTEMPGPILS